MRIAVFADGTWNKMDINDQGTNVVKLYRAAGAGAETPEQVTFYDPGVGTTKYTKFIGGAFGLGISRNIKDCYGFICEHWRDPNDQLFLFGFSRGAYTVRSLAGLLNFVGVLRQPESEGEFCRLIDRAYQLYRKAPEIKQAKETGRRSALVMELERFRREHVRDYEQKARIEMLGVWDTVGALGIPQSWLNELLNPFPDKFHDTRLGANVQRAYHAVAIDEKRKSFAPTLWDEDERAVQLYFAGVHSDVGGGYNDDCKLGNITLDWMAKRAAAHGLRLDASQLPQLTGDEYCGAQHESRTSYWRLVRRYDRELVRSPRFHISVRRRLEEEQRKFNPYPYAPPQITKPWEGRHWEETAGAAAAALSNG